MGFTIYWTYQHSIYVDSTPPMIKHPALNQQCRISLKGMCHAPADGDDESMSVQLSVLTRDVLLPYIHFSTSNIKIGILATGVSAT